MSNVSQHWVLAPPPVRHIAVKVSVSCEHCASPIALNAPAQQATCDACQRHSALPALADVLQTVAGNMRTLRLEGTDGNHVTEAFSSYRVQSYGRSSPNCLKCDAPVPIEQWMGYFGATTTLLCPACGSSLPTYPAPAWLREQLPTALQVFGGEAPATTAERAIPLAVENDTSNAIVMNCPACGAALTITREMERTIPCHYCNATVFLPDELWRRLHPVKLMARWTLTYCSELCTAARLERRKFADQPDRTTPVVGVPEAPGQRASLVGALIAFGVLMLVSAAVLVGYEYYDDYYDSMYLRERAMPGAMPYPPLMVEINRRLAKMPLVTGDAGTNAPSPVTSAPAKTLPGQPRRGTARSGVPQPRPIPAGEPTSGTGSTRAACGCSRDDLLCQMRCNSKRELEHEAH